MLARACIVVFCIVAYLVVASARVPAADNAAKQEVARTLEVGWGKSFRSVQPAQQHYERASKAAPLDSRVPYAFALVNLKHRKYPEAKKLLDEAIALDKQFLRARRAKIWIDMLLKRYSAALVQIEQLAELLPDDANSGDEEAREANRETARFLGRLFSFLAGPAEKSVRGEQVADAKRRVWEGLAEGFRKEFQTGHQAVADRFAELYLTRDQKKEEAQAQQRKTKKEKSKRLASEKDALAAEKKAVQQQALKTREELDKFLSDIERKLAPLDQELGRLTARATPLRSQIIRLDGDINRYLIRAENTEDPVLQARYRLDADRLQRVRAGYAAQYNALELQASRVRSEAAGLIRQRNGAIARYNEEAKRLGKEQVKLRRSEKRVAQQEERNKRPATGSTPKVTVLSRKVFAFTTYEPFPLEQEKARVLASFAK